MNDLLNETIKNFELKENRPEEVNPLMLAYIGDAVYEVIIRTIVINSGNRDMKLINRDAIKYVKAPTQAKIAELLYEKFTEEEQKQYKRGRNAKSGTKAKNATINDYRKATGFEAVIGFLYLKNEIDRIVYLCKLGIESL